jgi:hypothetical protein
VAFTVVLLTQDRFATGGNDEDQREAFGGAEGGGDLLVGDQNEVKFGTYLWRRGSKSGRKLSARSCAPFAVG